MATQAVAFNAGGQAVDDINQMQCNILNDISDGVLDAGIDENHDGGISGDEYYGEILSGSIGSGYDYGVEYGGMEFDVGRVEGGHWVDGERGIDATSPGFLMKIAAANQNASTFATEVVTMATKINELNAAVARMAKG